MNLDSKDISRLENMLETGPQRIVILSHYNPDGDAIGSSLAWARLLESMGHSVSCVVPNKYPYFLNWIPGVEKIKIFKEDQSGTIAADIQAAELIFCLDFNNISRLEGLTEIIETNTTARKILIDHHLQPPADYYTLMFSFPEASSTSYLVYKIIEAMGRTDIIDCDMGSALYTGMMTDTGNFTFSNLSPDLYRTIAALVEKGIDIPSINVEVYNSFTESRLRLLSYALGPKMHLIENGTVAYISLKESEMRKFCFQQGDSEGFVNYPLSIKGVKMSAMFLQTRKFIRISFRARGEVDVNVFARKYFEGGGHRNAAGGKSYVSMEATIEHYKKCVHEFFKDMPQPDDKTDASPCNKK